MIKGILIYGHNKWIFETIAAQPHKVSREAPVVVSAFFIFRKNRHNIVIRLTFCNRLLLLHAS
jgi:hypothetical protein